MNRNTKDVVTLVITVLSSLLTGGLYFYLWLLIRYLHEEA